MMVSGIVSISSLSHLLLLVYRNTGDFCVIYLYPSSLQNSFYCVPREALSPWTTLTKIVFYAVPCKEDSACSQDRHKHKKLLKPV